VAVYFIQAGPDGDIKIGTAISPPSRLREIQCGCPSECVIVGTLQGGRTEEREFHSKFKAHRLRKNGEWFAFRGELREFLAEKFPRPAFAEPAIINQRRAEYRKNLHDRIRVEKEGRDRALGDSEKCLSEFSRRHLRRLPSMSEADVLLELPCSALALRTMFARFKLPYECSAGSDMRYSAEAVRALANELFYVVQTYTLSLPGELVGDPGLYLSRQRKRTHAPTQQTDIAGRGAGDL
jgi:hypothetical protein